MALKRVASFHAVEINDLDTGRRRGRREKVADHHDVAHRQALSDSIERIVAAMVRGCLLLRKQHFPAVVEKTTNVSFLKNKFLGKTFSRDILRSGGSGMSQDASDGNVSDMPETRFPLTVHVFPGITLYLWRF